MQIKCKFIRNFICMVTSITISLDTRRARKNGTYPLILRISHQQQSSSIPLKLYLLEKDWDDKNRKIKKSFKSKDSITLLNNTLSKKLSNALDIVMKLQQEGELDSLSVTELKYKIENPVADHTFYSFTEVLVKDLKATNRFGTARSYEGVVRVLKTFTNYRNLNFENINYNFLTKFETYHLKNGNSLNGLSVYMRAIRAIYNKAIKAGIADKEKYPFAAYTIKTQPTEKRALEWDKLKKIIALQLEPGHPLFNARNYFVTSYMLYGMNFTDLAHLKESNILNNRIKYRRKKTSKLYDIEITQNLQKIFEHYLSQNNFGGYIFPILRTDDPAQQDRSIRWAQSRYNKKLKKIAVLCDIEENLTSYVSRHSFATQAMLKEVPLNAISSMMGHSSLKTTEVYLKSLPSNILDDYNKRIIG